VGSVVEVVDELCASAPCAEIVMSPAARRHRSRPRVQGTLLRDCTIRSSSSWVGACISHLRGGAENLRPCRMDGPMGMDSLREPSSRTTLRDSRWGRGGGSGSRQLRREQATVTLGALPATRSGRGSAFPVATATPSLTARRKRVQLRSENRGRRRSVARLGADTSRSGSRSAG
jgi:hypothetical protein